MLSMPMSSCDWSLRLLYRLASRTTSRPNEKGVCNGAQIMLQKFSFTFINEQFRVVIQYAARNFIWEFRSLSIKWVARRSIASHKILSSEPWTGLHYYHNATCQLLNLRTLFIVKYHNYVSTIWNVTERRSCDKSDKIPMSFNHLF